jgi:UDP-glucose 4-epimerase
MRVLVTGGAGYIGSAAAHSLIEQGFDVTVLDDFSTGKRENIPVEARIVSGSLLDPDSVLAALECCEAVMHFAGKSLVGESVEKPELYQMINVQGSKLLLMQMRSRGVKKIVFSSSAATYGKVDGSPIVEKVKPEPTNPYGKTKLEVENLISVESEDYGLCAISLRYFNVAGAKKIPSGWLLEQHDPETHLIPNVLKSSTENPIKIFGTDWPTPDGTCIRDYVHVMDLIDAHMKALRILETPGHTVLNLGSGKGFSVLEVINTASVITGKGVSYVESVRRQGDPAVLVADISNAKRILDWEPRYSLERMVSDSHLAEKWFTNNL